MSDSTPFSVSGFCLERIEDGSVVRWREEFESGSSTVAISVRSEAELQKALERFSKRVMLTWGFDWAR